MIYKKRCDTFGRVLYIKGILKRFDMTNCKPVIIPFEGKLSKEMSPLMPDEIEKMRNIPYQSNVGSLMYNALPKVIVNLADLGTLVKHA